MTSVAVPLKQLVDRALDRVADRTLSRGLALFRDTDHLHDLPCVDVPQLSRTFVRLHANVMQLTALGDVHLWGEWLNDGHGGPLMRIEVCCTSAALPGLGSGDSSLPVASSDAWFTASVVRRASGEVLGRRVANATTALAQPADAGHTLMRSRQAGQRVLLVGHHTLVPEATGRQMQQTGLRVDSAWDGEDVAARMHAHTYHLALLNLQMPTGDVMRAARAIRHQGGPTLPIVAMMTCELALNQAGLQVAGRNDAHVATMSQSMLLTTLSRWLPAAAALRPGAGSQTLAATAWPVELLGDRLACVEGFDAVRALRNVGGQKSALVSVLRRFIDTYRKGLPEVPDLPEVRSAADATRWRYATHGLLGACAMIGATDLQLELEAANPTLPADGADSRLSLRLHRLSDKLIDFCARLERALAQ